MERTSKGIFEFLCIQMEKLDKKQISVEHLKAQAGSVKQLNNLLKYELDRAKAIKTHSDLNIREIEDYAA
jgi:hypothetical protein